MFAAKGSKLMKPIFILGAVLILGGSSLPAAAKETPREINACDFLKTEEVEAALKLKIQPGMRRDMGLNESGDEAFTNSYTSTCLWRIGPKNAQPADPNLPLGGASFVVLNVMQWPAGSGGGKKFLKNFRDAAKSGEIGQEPVPLKIAEESLWWGDGVAVSKGDRGFGISVHLVGGRDQERGLEEALAKKIAARI